MVEDVHIIRTLYDSKALNAKHVETMLLGGMWQYYASNHTDADLHSFKKGVEEVFKHSCISEVSKRKAWNSALRRMENMVPAFGDLINEW